MRTYEECQEELDILKDLMSTETENNHTPRDYQRATEYIQELVYKEKPTEIYELTTEGDKPLTPRGVVVCSCCDGYVDKTDKFCKHCGQALRGDE